MSELKPGWRRLQFNEIVTSVGATRKARGWSAAEAGVDRYVSLEHLDPNSPTIRRWGSPEDVGENSDLRPFEAGDVILARRGIEQRKVGFATFNGVASGHALVFRARPGVVLPEFLPYFLLSDAFMACVEQFSAGSLSKTVNLSSLLRLEFALPPLEEQRRIAEQFSAIDRLVDSHCLVESQGKILADSLIDALLDGDHICLPDELLKSLCPGQWKPVLLGEICTLSNGHGFKPRDWSETGMPIIRIQNVRGSSNFNYYDGVADPRWIVQPGELLFAWAGVPGVSFGPGIWSGPPGVLNQHIYRVTPRTGVDAVWLYEILRYLTPKIERRAHGFKASLLHIKQSEFKNQKILLPPPQEQVFVVEAINQIRGWVMMLGRRHIQARQLLPLAMQILSP